MGTPGTLEQKHAAGGTVGTKRGHVFWLFGLSGVGKSTLAAALRRELEQTEGAGALMLDGDRLRAGLCRGLGFSETERRENLRRAAEVARLGIESGLTVIAAFITPREAHRTMVRAIIGEADVSLIHVAAPLDVCRRRDVKGLYARAAVGEVTRMTGVDSAFDPPRLFDFRIETAARDVATCTMELMALREIVLRRKAGQDSAS